MAEAHAPAGAPRALPAPRAGEMRALAEQALSRAAGAPLCGGNEVRILRDAAENYPAWHAAIASARSRIYFDNYIIANDEVGRGFVDALVARARAGVRVRVIYDWMGGAATATRSLWAPLVAAGGEVRCFNPPQFASPFGWLTRNHRKMIAVDGSVAFVSGLCVSRKWLGDPPRGIAPWRDTGVEVRGPALADIEEAFAEVWAAAGEAIPAAELAGRGAIAPAGDVALRVLAATPNQAGLFRLDQLIAVLARRTLWIADAYFVGLAPYVQALRAAALDGVDVRLLVPGASDLPLVAGLSRAGYRPLLEAGVRVFEWNGSMMHAKTAVADGRWARVGSSNLNLSSWIGNYELDVAVEDERFAAAMAAMYEADVENATEIVLSPRHRVRPAAPGARRRHRGGSASRAAAGALRIGNTVGAAMTGRRLLGPAEAGVIGAVGLALAGFAALGLLWPPLVAVPLALLAGWIALALLARAIGLRRQARAQPGPSHPRRS